MDVVLDGTRLKFMLKKNYLIGELPGWGTLHLQQVDDARFRSITPPDSAGEFQVQLDWQIQGDEWCWRFSTGLPGTRHKGAELTWHLKAQAHRLNT
jgi:hypothetical protein